MAPIFVTGDNLVVYNAMKPHQGFRTSFFDGIYEPKKAWPGRHCGLVSGGTESPACKLFQVIKESGQTYPYREHYKFWPGPNSNTFVAWVLAQVPEVQFDLPRNAIGKNYSLPQTVTQ